MTDAERIELDAIVTVVLNNRAFRAQLENGHEVIVYDAEDARAEPGRRVRVALSPYDMSSGRWVSGPDGKENDESA